MHSVFFSMRRAQLCVQKLQWNELEEADLADDVTPQQLDMLRIVYEREGVMRWQLVALLGVAGPAVSRMLGRLQRKKLIVKTKWEHDARYVRVELTELGEAVVKHAMSTACAPSYAGFVARGATASESDEQVEAFGRRLLDMRIALGDRSMFVHPWMRVDMSQGYSLRKPPPPEAIHAPRDGRGG